MEHFDCMGVPSARTSALKIMRPILSAVLWCVSALAASAAEGPDLAPIRRWIARQDDFHSVQAEFTQTRALRALRSPVAIHGKLWFVSPDLLRWELGDPPKTIVLQKAGAYYVIQPARKKVERTAAGQLGKKGGMQPFAMMKFPLAKDFNDFNRQFEVLSVNTVENRCHIEIAPRDAQARKFMEAIRIDFDTVTAQLLIFEIATRDGSSMRNEFSNVKMNLKIDRRVFDFDFTGYEMTDARE